MMIKFEDYIVPAITSCKVERVTRRTEVEYNANGDMLIDLVARKYRLTLKIGVLKASQVKEILNFTEKIFFNVTFDCPHKGTITRIFHVENEPFEHLKKVTNTVFFDKLELVLIERQKGVNVWKVSDEFKRKSLEFGRNIMCKVFVGDEVFYDDAIIEFTFNDVLHKNSFSVGCTEPNRFHIIIKTSKNIPIDAVVRPFIAFDESDNDDTEWCPLGVFYITNRYKKQSLIYLTCYDKMALLNEEFAVQSAIPGNVQTIFNEVCSFYSIEHNFVSGNYKIEFVPESITAREILSYCAGMNGCSLKFDRLGKLIVKDFSNIADNLTRDNYISFSQNYSTFTVNEVLFRANGVDIKAGEGGKLSRIFALNDFATQQTVNAVLKKYSDFKYQSGEIKFKGLPHLEAGDRISVEDRYSDELSPLVISEIEYRYKGGLSATLFSKKLYEDETFVLASDLDISKEVIYKELSTSFLKSTNTSQLSISTLPNKVAEFNIKAYKNTFIELNIVINAQSNVDDFLYIMINVNNLSRPLVSRNKLALGEKETICLHHLDEYLYMGTNTIEVYAYSQNGTITVLPRELEVTLTGQMIDGSGGKGRPQAQHFYEFNNIKLETRVVSVNNIDTSYNVSKVVKSGKWSIEISPHMLQNTEVNLKNLSFTLQETLEEYEDETQE